MQKLTGSQVRDGRMMLGWTQSELARHSKVEFSAVFALELYDWTSDDDLGRICEAMLAHGIEIMSDRVVRSSNGLSAALRQHLATSVGQTP